MPKRAIKIRNKAIGYIEGSRFIKTVVGSRHKLHKPPAWAVDAEAFDKDIKPNVTEIVVIDKETGIKYHTSVDNFNRFKGELDRGFGRQYYLKLNYWQVRDHNNQRFSF